MDTPVFLQELASRRSLFESRALFLQRVRAFFLSRGFLEVDAPLLVPAAGMEPHLDPFEVRGWATGQTAFLPTSPEFYLKKLLASGVERCYCLAPAFRDEPPSKGHSPEFLMLEWYRAGADHGAILKDCADLLDDVGRRFLPGGVLEREGLRCDLTAGLEVMALGEAFARFAGVDWRDLHTLGEWRRAARDRGAEGAESNGAEGAENNGTEAAGGWSENDCFSYLMVSDVEPALAKMSRPVALVGYPAFQAALARLNPQDPRVSDRFELYAAGVELANAYTELTDARQQRCRYEAYQAERRAGGKPLHPADAQFLEAVGHLPPCAGIALGADRLLSLLLGEPLLRVRHGC